MSGKIRVMVWLMLGLILVPLVAACGQPQAASKPPESKRLVVAAGVDVLTLSPFREVITTPDRQMILNIHDALVAFDESGNAVPILAESWKNLDDLTWQLKLRRGVKFHNGEPFDAESVKVTLEAMTDPATKTPRAGNYSFIDRVDIIDQYTVNIKTKVPAPYTLNELAPLGIAPAKYTKEKGVDYTEKNPVGTGPFKFVEWVKDDHITLAANKEYWGGAPKIDTLVFKPIKEAATRVGALIAGEVDVALNVPPEVVPEIRNSARATAKTVPSLRTFLVGMSTLDKSYPTTNKLVRQALNMAVDRESLNKNILGGYGRVSYGLNPTTFGFNPDLKPIPYDPKKAKELLAQAGYPNGFSVVMDSPDGRYTKDKEMAQAIAGQLAEVGVKVEVKTYEWGVFTKKVFDHKASPLFLFAWGHGNYDYNSQIQLTLVTNGQWSQYSNPELDALQAKTMGTIDREARKKLLFQLQDILREDAPYIYLVQPGDIYGMAKDVDWNPRGDEILWFGKAARTGR